jgi:hypothetical protein
MNCKYWILPLVMVIALSIVRADCTGPECIGDSANSPQLDIKDCTVEIDGRYVEPDTTIFKAFDRGGEIEVSVEIVSFQDAQDVQMEALILGYEHGSKNTNLISDISPVFDVKANRSYRKVMTLTLPDDLSSGELKLRIIISDRSSSTFVRDYNLDIEATNHDVVIKDIILDPSDSIVSGNGLVASVRVKNNGDKDENGVKVTVAIPALKVSAVNYIDEIQSDDSETSGDMYLRLPDCAETGLYVVRTTVDYDDGYETISQDTVIRVEQDKKCANPNEEDGTGTTPVTEDKTVITVPARQDVVIGTSGAIYPIMISNTGTTTKTYTISVSGIDAWATYRIDPSAVLTVGPKKTEAAYLYITAKQGVTPEDKVFVATIQSGTEVKQVPLTATIKSSSSSPTGNVIGGTTTDWNKIKQGLEIGLVVLVVLLVILGLIIGFGKLKGKEEEPEEEVSGQTYY